ncbi:hypothetical protein [uncultured Paludibaculum sp.]|uniref:hypothetical protein n=1 Tax=uncultured Paludibaculum sp. TaxID=1765020 RepID=UPI002AAB5F2D|nr:hypothetical protein [uncultured Paludibaculum sp.]
MPLATHVRILAWFNIVLGAIGVFAALFTFAGASFLHLLLADVIREASTIPVDVIQLGATILIGLILVMSLPCLVLGFGLYYVRPWARILGLILAAINLLYFPLGTAISLYGFWVLLKPETEAMFRQTAVARA